MNWIENILTGSLNGLLEEEKKQREYKYSIANENILPLEIHSSKVKVINSLMFDQVQFVCHVFDNVYLTN